MIYLQNYKQMNRSTWKSLVLVFSVVFTFAATSYAGDMDTLEIDLYTALKIAGESAPEIIQNKWNEETAYLGWRASFVERYYPQLDLSLQVPTYSETRQEDISGRFKTKSERWLGSVDVSQPLPTGGSIDIFSSFYQRLYRSENQFGSTGEFNQTYNVDEVSQAYYVQLSQDFLNYNLAKLSEYKSRLSYERTSLGIIHSNRQLTYRILSSYYTLLMSIRQLEISRDDLEASSETADLARRKFGSGLIPEVEALQLEVEVLQKDAELNQSISNLEAQLDQFRTLLGLELEIPIKLIGEPDFQELKVDLDEATEKALNSRRDLKQAELDLNLAKTGLKDAKRPYNPTGSIYAFYGIDNLDETWEDVFNRSLNEFNADRGLTLSFEMPIWTSGRRSIAVQKAKIAIRNSEFEKDELQKAIILEVREAVRNLEETKLRYQTNVKSLELAQTSYEMTRDRFENGQVNAREWIEAQLSLKRNRINAFRAIVDQNLAVANYKLVVGDAIIDNIQLPGEEIITR